MPRIPYAEPGTEAELATPVYESMKASKGMVPNLLKVVGHSGPVTQSMGNLLATYYKGLTIDLKTREAAYLTCASLNDCAYCQGHHRPAAKKAGFTPEQIEVLGEAGLESEHLTTQERSVVRFAYETTRRVVAREDAMIELKKHFSTQEIVEIAFVVALANFTQRIGRNFGIELEAKS